MIIEFKKYLLLEYDYTDILVDFIGNDKVYTFLHTTTSEDACKNIFENGFEFYDFSKTTDNVNNDSVTIDWKLSLRKDYGNFTIIIQIKPGFDSYEELCEKKPYENEEGELVYTLPREYVKGYLNKKTSEIVRNPHFKLP